MARNKVFSLLLLSIVGCASDGEVGTGRGSTALLYSLTDPVLTKSCDFTISSLPLPSGTRLNQKGWKYCMAASVSGFGSLFVEADDVILDGTALRQARGSGDIRNYLSWRSQMPVTNVSVPSVRNVTVVNMDVKGEINIGQKSSTAAPGTVVRDSTLTKFTIYGPGPVRFLRNIVHWPNSNTTDPNYEVRGHLWAAISDKPAVPNRSDYILMGNVFLSDEYSATDEPSMMWIHYTKNFLIANNYFYVTAGGRLKDIVRFRDDSSYGILENNKFQYAPSWLVDAGTGKSAWGGGTLHFATGDTEPIRPRGILVRNNWVRSTDATAVDTQGFSRGNIFDHNIFVGNGRALAGYNPGAPDTDPNLNRSTYNTFVSFSGDKAVHTFSEAMYSNALKFEKNLVVNLNSSSSWLLDRESSATFACEGDSSGSTLFGSMNMFYGLNTSASSCFLGTSYIKKNPLFVNANLGASGDFHIGECSDGNPHGAYLCNNVNYVTPSIPQNVRVVAMTGSNEVHGNNLTWDASTDDHGVTEYVVEKAVGATGSFVEVDKGLGPGILGPGMFDPEVIDGTTYRYRLRAVDADAHFSGYSSEVQVTYGTSTGGDLTAPSVPPSVSATPISTSQISVSWNASTDNVGVASYKVYRGTSSSTLAFVQSTSSQAFGDSGLSASTAYFYAVSAIDAAGNESAQSTVVSASTTANTGDVTPPTAPSVLLAKETSFSSVHLSWVAASDNVGVSTYEVRRGGVTIGSTSTLVFDDTGLAASTHYSYTVVAKDLAGNYSLASNTAEVDTMANIVSGLSVSRNYSLTSPPAYQSTILTGTNQVMYVDNSAPKFGAAPSFLTNHQLLQTLNADKSSSENALTVTFSLASAAEVFVLFDVDIEKAGKTPLWLSSNFIRLGATVNTNNGARSVYHKLFPVGSVTLKGNQSDGTATGISMYTVVVRPVLISMKDPVTHIPALIGSTMNFAKYAIPATWSPMQIDFGVPETNVTLDFSSAYASGKLKLYNVQQPGVQYSCAARTIMRDTDANGVAQFYPQFGVSDLNSVATLPANVAIRAGGVLLANATARSTDLNIFAGTDSVDLAIELQMRYATSYLPAGDFNLDQKIDSVDLALFVSARFASPIDQATYCQ